MHPSVRWDDGRNFNVPSIAIVVPATAPAKPGGKLGPVPNLELCFVVAKSLATCKVNQISFANFSAKPT